MTDRMFEFPHLGSHLIRGDPPRVEPRLDFCFCSRTIRCQVQIIRRADARGTAVRHFESDGATYTRLVNLGGHGALGLMRLDRDGHLGRRPATSPQVAIVLSGVGATSGADGAAVAVGAGDLIFWASGEEPETSIRRSGDCGRTLSDQGLTTGRSPR